MLLLITFPIRFSPGGKVMQADPGGGGGAWREFDLVLSVLDSKNMHIMVKLTNGPLWQRTLMRALDLD